MFNEVTNFDKALTAEHISSNLGQYEAARSGFFVFEVDFGTSVVNGGGTLPLVKAGVAKNAAQSSANYKGNDVIEHATDYLRLNVTKAPVPHFDLEDLKYRRGNEEVHFAGVPTFQTGSIRVDDVVGLDTKSILMAWQALAYDVKTRKGGRMVDYKRNATLYEYTQDYEIIRKWNLYGCWVKTINEDDFDKESDTNRKITADIIYDRAEMVMPDES